MKELSSKYPEKYIPFIFMLHNIVAFIFLSRETEQ